ncbi:MAG: hypothetical protein KJO98_11935, partial [Rhodothermia bacterium]|nr:hypothetical protein [Rhodothermia bacterium]
MNNIDNHLNVWLVCLLAAIVALPVQAQNQSFEYATGIKTQVPYVASGAITLDGVADEAEWAGAQVVDPTVQWDGAWSGHPEADVLASGRLLYTEGMLYIYIEVEDYDVSIDTENPGQSDQILLGVDLVHDPGVTDVQTDGDFAGFIANAPDQGPVTYKIAHGLGVTLNWDAANGDPVAEGWVQGTTFFDETTLVWGAELAIVNPAITTDAEIGFNLGLGLAKAEGAGDRGEATYAFSSWVVCNPDLLEDELWCGPGGTVMSDAHSFATLDLLPSGVLPYGMG